MNALGVVLSALRAGDHATALTHALAAWQVRRHPRIAAVIEELGAKVASTRERPDGKTNPDKQKRWLKLAKANDPRDIDVLLATLPEIKQKLFLEARVKALAGREDPRIASAMVGLLEHPPIATASGVGTLSLAFDRILEIGDPRTLDRLDALAIALADSDGKHTAIYVLSRTLRANVERLRAELAKVDVELWDEAEQVLDEIEKLVAANRPPARTKDREQLFAAVYADPADDGARSVLADFLQEHGDPRGELIALQLARAAGGPRSKREIDLLRFHAREWLGPIEPLVNKTDMVYERGFLARCAVTTERVREVGPLLGRPEWTTVEDVYVDTWYDDLRPLLASMPALRALRGVRFSQRLVAHDGVERLAVANLEAGDVARFCDLAYPRLRDLQISAAPTLDEMQPFWSSLGKQLHRFTAGVNGFEAWLRFAASQPIPEIALSSRSWNPWRLWFSGDTLRVEYLWSSMTPNIEGLLADHLVLVPSPARWNVAIEHAVERTPALAAALERFASHVIEKPKKKSRGAK